MTETLSYTVIHKDNEFELRQYPAHIKAEVEVSAEDYKSAVQKAFNILAGYIFGGNISQQSIAMTTPVTASSSQKIAMTTPVTVTGSDTFTVAFIMPSAYDLQSLPLPADARVRLTPVEPQRMAVIRFRGYFPLERIEQSKARLLQWAEAHELQPTGEFTVAGYNPPWVPGFLARNEVLIAVQAAA